MTEKLQSLSRKLPFRCFGILYRMFRNLASRNTASLSLTEAVPLIIAGESCSLYYLISGGGAHTE